MTIVLLFALPFLFAVSFEADYPLDTQIALAYTQSSLTSLQTKGTGISEAEQIIIKNILAEAIAQEGERELDNIDNIRAQLAAKLGGKWNGIIFDDGGFICNWNAWRYITQDKWFTYQKFQRYNWDYTFWQTSSKNSESSNRNMGRKVSTYLESLRNQDSSNNLIRYWLPEQIRLSENLTSLEQATIQGIYRTSAAINKDSFPTNANYIRSSVESFMGGLWDGFLASEECGWAARYELVESKRERQDFFGPNKWYYYIWKTQ